MGPGLTLNFFGWKIVKNSPVLVHVLIFLDTMCILCVGLLPIHIRYKRMLFINMIEKSLDGVEWGELYTICFLGFWIFFNFESPSPTVYYKTVV